jgi:hypothetical protein
MQNLLNYLKDKKNKDEKESYQVLNEVDQVIPQQYPLREVMLNEITNG